MFELNYPKDRIINRDLLKMYFEASCPLINGQFKVPVVILIISISTLFSIYFQVFCSYIFYEVTCIISSIS